MLKEEDLPTKLPPKELRDYRRKIAITLIEIGGNDDWCGEVCRLCDRTSPPPSKRFGSNPKEWGWVCCDFCKPVKWYHGVCLGIRGRTEYLSEISYFCGKKLVQDEIFTLKLGETLIRQRTRVRNSGSVSHAKAP
ncbi:uncharacterized protein [Clytia hemisphaerica]|uniref:uncharacterized protein n=1 Tax=Clytia hemisphaerica TaxID=252671 RepID=UPI0034D48414